MSNIAIRPLQPSDRDGWQGLWAQYNAFYGREGAAALGQRTVETTWQRLLDDEEPIFGLVAERQGALIGLAHYIFHRNTIQIADTCYMQDLFTTEESRGHGVGRKLIATIADRCRRRGVHDIYWHTHNFNEVARGLYDRVARNTEFIVYRTKIK